MLAARRDKIEMEKIQEKACNSNHKKYKKLESCEWQGGFFTIFSPNKRMHDNSTTPL